MSQIITELATIEVSNEVLQQMDIGGIYQSFSKNFRELGDLKNFRTEYEKKNRLMRWWHNDKLLDAQLDSAEVQAEFSKTIGQLMMISIMQSKKLSEQQTQLNDQQGRLKTQADGIAEHAAELQEQHQVLAEQSQRLETLVREYFELKGLTEEGAQKLIEIAREVKATKAQMLEEFALRATGVEAVCAEMQSRMESASAKIDERICRNEETTQAGIAGLQRDAREAKASYEASHRAYQEATQDALNLGLEKLARSQREAVAGLHTQQATLVSRVSGLIDQQQTHHDVMTAFQKDVSTSLKRLRYAAVGLSLVSLGLAGALAYLMRSV